MALFPKQVDTPAIDKTWNTFSNQFIAVFDHLREYEVVYHQQAAALGLPDLFPDTMDPWDSQEKGKPKAIVCPMQDCDVMFTSRLVAAMHLFLGYRKQRNADRRCQKRLIDMLFGTWSPLPGSDLVFYCPMLGCQMT